jgi:hypothetical protein
MDLKLNTQTHDLLVTDGDLQVFSDNGAIRQNLKQRLLFFLGEWFLDTSQGVPYYQFILVKNPNLDLVESTLKDVVLSTTGILELDTFQLDYTRGTRQLQVSLQAKSTEGDISLVAGV